LKKENSRKIKSLSIWLLLFFTVCSFLLLASPQVGTSKLRKEIPRQEYEVKAMFLVLFIRHVQWPSYSGINDRTKPFNIVVMGGNPFGEHLDVKTAGKRISGKNIKIIYIDDIEDIPECYILFVADMSRNKLTEVIQKTKKKPILIVGDTDGYTQRGVHINLLLVDNRINLEVNETAVHEANLILSDSTLDNSTIINPFFKEKALQIEKISQFIEWNNYGTINSNPTFNITILGDDSQVSLWEDLFENKKLSNKPVRIHSTSRVQDIGNPQLLFIARTIRKRIWDVIDYVGNKPIFTISDTNTFKNSGIHMVLYYRYGKDDQQKLAMKVNTEEVKKVGLSLSFHLLQAAEVVTTVKRTLTDEDSEQ